MVTDEQVKRLRVFMKRGTNEIAASKAGMGEKTARKYMKLGKLPSEIRKAHDWRTRTDPFWDVWGSIKSMLEVNEGLEGKTIFEYLQREHPGRFPSGQMRTLQRRIKQWRATDGPAKEVFFPQIHYPGVLSESDFTYMNELGVTIKGELFEHLFYHFVLTYSNWETGTICYSESFESLSAGYQNAVWELGGVTKKHRTDRMSSAVNKDCNPEKFTVRYSALLRYYDVLPERTNPASANENGDIEQRHFRFKGAVKQALMMRGSSNFASREEYGRFIRKILDQANSGRAKRLQEELTLLIKLPTRRLNDYQPLEVTVGQGSTINVQQNIYSVHSRLRDERVLVKVYVAHIEVWYAQKLVESIPRLKGKEKHFIQYRHIIDWLVRKPGAFEDYRYKADMFPSSYFRMAFDYLKTHNPLRANKEYVNILHMAATDGETVTESAIRSLLSKEQPISEESVRQLVKTSTQLPLITDIAIDDVVLSLYDDLLSTGKEVAING